ncbi:glycosyl transferase [Marinilongibacter aquaticus]|uniref:glycosyltransferase n=1 Tax=Marinilongibacter aquaticus TaxID=2975157 RepID=UPI0021BDA833|nr:glycosyltransferase [Marinilongibacter aquaticus]UBM57923.1 glycosyl transferase [Marinilongibacter aquaticus]
MTVAFTICSNNYISQAKALADSLRKTNPEIRFYIGLTDHFDKIPEPYKLSFQEYNILEVEEIGIPNLDWMHENYDIIELNTATKPYYFQYLFEKHAEADKFIFFDPDIVVYRSLNELEHRLDSQDIVLTPHLTKPIEDSRDDFFIHEHDILNHGVFNLGFVAINHSENAKRFINWWADRLSTQCRHDLCQGLFVDQLWCNLAPSYFEKVYTDKDPGKNMAYWNLQERTLSKKNGEYFVNAEHPLIFFHFSTFNPSIEDNIATKQNRFTLKNRPDLRELYCDYEKQVTANHFHELKTLSCDFGKPLEKYKAPSQFASLLSFPFKLATKLIEKYL